jgi:hypothetical protein
LGEFNAEEYIICQLEILAAVRAVLTLQERLRDRRAVLFIDNMSALAAIITGHTGQVHMNMLHTILAALQVDR